MELNKIYQMDCIEGMKQLEDDSINLICIDPPYNIGKDKRWDKYKQDDYIAFMGEVFKQCERVLKPNGSFYWFHNDIKQINKLMDLLEKETSFIYKQFIVWNKRFEGAKNKGFLDGFIEVDGLRNYQKMAEYCLFYTFQDETGRKLVDHDVTNYKTLRYYSKGVKDFIGLNLKEINRKLGHRKAEHFFYWNTKQFSLPTIQTYEELIDTFNINEWESFKPLEELRQEYEELRQEYESFRYIYHNHKTHHSVWDYEIEKKQGHLTPKPVKLIENIIKHSSNEGDTVLDCFMGSGTTAIAAIRTNRNYIGFERESEYIQIAQKRIEDTKELMQDGDLFTLDNLGGAE